MKQGCEHWKRELKWSADDIKSGITESSELPCPISKPQWKQKDMFSYSVKYILFLSFKLKAYLPEKRDLLFVGADVLFHVPDV